VKNKPPFGYFTGAYGAITDFQNNGTSSVVDASTSAVFSPVFSPIDDGITILLWLGFALGVVRIFRNLDT
jgi:hypothetical protein